MVIAPDTLPAHLPSNSSHTLLHTTLPFSTNSVPTLVDSDKPISIRDPTAAIPSPTPIDPEALDIKIIGTIPFAHILQDGTSAFQLQIMPALSEEYLHAKTTLLEQKTEEQILHEVVSPGYHEFADIFSEGSVKELLLHHSYNYKINLEEGTSPLFGKVYNMSKIELQALKDSLDNMLGKGNSDTSPANPNSPLANSDTFSTAVNTSLDSAEPLGPSPVIPDSATHHQLHSMLNTL
ncbi:hypothetical protein E4T56_gene7962 [Termitomyces sp. T112]|nr:hypothetical protein E4T56_gene7962 [Termitomyces sp. T112]